MMRVRRQKSEAQGRDTCEQVPQRYSSSPSRPSCTLKAEGTELKKHVLPCTGPVKKKLLFIKVKEHSDTVNCYSEL